MSASLRLCESCLLVQACTLLTKMNLLFIFDFAMKHLSRYYEKVLCYVIVFIVTPLVFIFEMTLVRPKIIEQYQFGPVKQWFHTILPIFLFMNITGNMMMSILTDTRLKKSDPSGTFCEHCSVYRPSNSWHCRSCNSCIMRRDHHCAFFCRCIGLNNRRYYVAYLGYIMISMAYIVFYNYLFISSKFDDIALILSMVRIFNPLLRFMATETMGIDDLYVLLWIMNGGLLIWSSALFFFHIQNVFKGVTSRDRHTVSLEYLDWSKCKENMVGVFGVKWYWAILCPFVISPIPDTFKVE